MSEKSLDRQNGETSGERIENSAPGLNDKIEFMGRQLHIQTEKIGLPVPRIVTQVFSNGRVVFSKKSDVSPPQELLKIEELMRDQHSRTIREIADKQKRILGSS